MPSHIAKAPKISLIASIGRNRELGLKNGLLWPIPDDLKRFKDLTTGHSMIMGLKTYRSIGRPLPGRTSIVLSKETLNIPGVLLARSLDEAIKLASRSPGSNEVFIIGGGQVFAQTISRADKLYLTLVDAEAEADVFFPDYSMFAKKVFEESREHNGLKYTWIDLER